MAHNQRHPDPDPRDQPENPCRKANRTKLMSAFAAAGALALAACSGPAGAPQGGNAATPADAPTAVATGEPGAVKVARGFLDAFGDFDADRTLTYLAEDAHLQLDADTAEELPLLISFFEAQGYKQMLGPCEEPFASAAGTHVRCPFTFHAIRSDEIGRGPFGGSYWDLTVRGGEIVEVSQYFEIAKFGPQMWDPFQEWVSETHPKDFEVMYTVGGDNFRLTEKSIRLWRQHTRAYVEQVGQ